jgi:hypothetical protein
MTNKKIKEIVEEVKPTIGDIADVTYLVLKKEKHQKPGILPTEEKIDEKTWEHKKDAKISLRTDKRSVSWLSRIPMSYELVFEMGLKLLRCPYSEYCPTGIEKSKQHYLDAVKKQNKK